MLGTKPHYDTHTHTILSKDTQEFS